jgi:hypothetical protein
VVFLLYLELIDCAKDSMPKEKPKNQNIFVCGVLGDVCASFGRGMAFLLHLALIAITSIPFLHLKKARCSFMHGLVFLTCASAHYVEPRRGLREVPRFPPDWPNAFTHFVRMSLEMNAEGGKGIPPPARYDQTYTTKLRSLLVTLLPPPPSESECDDASDDDDAL